MYTENFGFLKIETPPNKMKFNEEQRKFIVKSFARNNSATLVRRDYLLQYKISDGKKRSKYAINDFIRVNNHFDRTGTVHSGPRQRPKPKRSQENVEKINEGCNRPNDFQCGKSRLSYNSVLLPSGESCATTPRRSSTDLLLSSL